jgi:hypothetical protein
MLMSLADPLLQSPSTFLEEQVRIDRPVILQFGRFCISRASERISMRNDKFAEGSPLSGDRAFYWLSTRADT